MNEQRSFDGVGALRFAVPLAAIGWLGLGLGWTLTPGDTWFAYLWVFAGTAAITIGALIFLMTSYVVHARWSVVIRPLNEAIVRVIPLLALLFVPLCFGLRYLYPWAREPLGLDEHARELLRHKRAYLNPSFFWLRSGVYFAVWWCAALLLTRRPRRQTANLADARGAHRWAAALLPPTAVCLTFAAFDWLMSLDPFWASSIFGVYYFAGGFVASFGLLAVLAERSLRSGTLADVVGPNHFHAIGRLMFGFSIFWAYIAFFQALLIQIANRPDEVAFYVRRLGHGWKLVLELMVLARFVLPFFLLLPRRVKFRPGFVAACGGLLIVGQYLDAFWLVAPQRAPEHALPRLVDLAALLAVIGSVVSFGVWRARGASAVPRGDPALARSIAYRSTQ
jgi:hypothetical protein